MTKGGGGPARLLGPILGVVFLAILGLVVLGVIKIGKAVKHDWQTVDEIRSKDSALVDAQRQAGKEYMDKLRLTLSAEASPGQDQSVKATLTGRIANTGNKDVIRVAVAVKFLSAQGDSVVDSRDVILFDASDVSVTTDSPLAGGEERAIMKTVDGIKPEWSNGKISYEIREVRINVPQQ